MTIDRLKRAVDWQSTPVLTDDDIEDLIYLSSVKDEFDVPEMDGDGRPIFNFRYACYLGWQRKAAKAAGMIDFSADDASFRRDQYLAHCAAMMRQFGYVGSLSTTEA